ncbi:MAG: large conductance mechanosensitive channel protein MscL [Henriciella sp.]|jgi:large conductance mechanosensitive channel|uniref:large conductance mechanosensitive channel protein MscL n=1 Tax=Henriciella sp. TaxID=1968823 RepID=UPI000C0D5EBB|nr:large conductance mechanosensitive channel protein MscL [Henriciella sp.]MAN74895.1 large conductance mechanosensitive channel protein MscL [Henriciella sp.]MBF33910.1 large conductance mechanosensitive channel protein MscL [Hyphomonadaceae bacterium]PHR79787.1 MAG: large conductance mechanosensitive channel protein MscL [Henriciella sp.]|tara:strand:- start:7219 stop:7641 length:423 start_codon:yes stop_codon:yes gene_type:complete
MFKEFKEFAMRGNLVDLAVGFILGGAFSTIVKSLVNDIVMPPLGLVLGGVDFADLIYPLDGNTYESLEAANEAGAPVIAYGLFINNVISFLIMALALFFLVKGINSMKRKQEEAPAEVPPPPRQEILLEEIRNLLAKQQG